MSDTRYITTTEVAKLVRKALKARFPAVKFSVRSSYYANGSSIRVSYMDGPLTDEVEQVTSLYTGASFDGMIDLKSYHTSILTTDDGAEEVYFGADYIFVNRSVSDEFRATLVEKFEALYEAPYDESASYLERDPATGCDRMWKESGSVLLYRLAHATAAPMK